MTTKRKGEDKAKKEMPKKETAKPATSKPKEAEFKVFVAQVA